MNDQDKLLRLSQAAGVVQQITGERPHVSTLHRWVQRGSHGVRLRTTYALGAKRTTEAWIREYFDATNAAKLGLPHVSPRSSGNRVDRLAKVNAELDRELAR